MKWKKYIKPYLPYFIAGPLCMILEVIGEVLMPWFLKSVLNEGTGGTLTVGKSVLYAGAMVLTALLMMAGGVGGAYFGTKASVGFATDLRLDLYKHVQCFSFANIDKFSAGSLVTRLTNDVTQLQNFVNMLLRMCLRAPGMMIGALVMSIMIRPSLSAVFCVSIPILVIVVFIIIRMGFPRFTKMQQKIDELNSTVQENIMRKKNLRLQIRG